MTADERGVSTQRRFTPRGKRQTLTVVTPFGARTFEIAEIDANAYEIPRLSVGPQFSAAEFTLEYDLPPVPFEEGVRLDRIRLWFQPRVVPRHRPRLTLPRRYTPSLRNFHRTQHLRGI